LLCRHSAARSFALKILSLQRSGFSVDNSVAIPASSRKARRRPSTGSAGSAPLRSGLSAPTGSSASDEEDDKDSDQESEKKKKRKFF
jgi:hypothetical protein